MIAELIFAAAEFFSGDPKRIQHFIKVHSLARLIGAAEGLDGEELLTLEAAAVVHDVGIKPAEEKYGNCSGKLQEQEGPAAAEPLLRKCGFEEGVVQRVLWLVAHHHTYDNIDSADWQILVEADFLVNLYEDGADGETVRAAMDRVFATETGIRLCRTFFSTALK